MQAACTHWRSEPCGCRCVQDMRRAHSADLPVVEVHVGAGKFRSRESAKMKPLTSFVEFGRSLASVAIDKDAGSGAAAAGSESPRGIKRKPVHVAKTSFDGTDSPRLWPRADAGANVAGREQQGGRSEDVAAVDATGDPGVSHGVDDISTSCACYSGADTAEQGCVGFGSPIAGLIRQDSRPSSSQQAAPRRRPRHSERQGLDAHELGSAGVEVGYTSGDLSEVCTYERQTPVVPPGTGATVCHRDSGNRSQGQGLLAEGPSGFDLSRAAPRDHDGVTSLSTHLNLQQTAEPVHQARAPNKVVKPVDSRVFSQVGAQAVDLADLIGAWQRQEVHIDAGDAKTVADAIMRGLKRH